MSTHTEPDIDTLQGALVQSLPGASRGTIVHGDYRLDNTILDAADSGLIRAIVDWEMATLGDALANLGMVSEPVPGVEHILRGNPSFPTAAEMAERTPQTPAQTWKGFPYTARSATSRSPSSPKGFTPATSRATPSAPASTRSARR